MIMLTNPKPKIAPDGYTLVQRQYTEYDPVKWMDLINSVNREFGKAGQRTSSAL